MYNVMAALLTSLLITILAIPFFIRWLRGRGIGQYIREDGPSVHFAKEGTPTMGGAIIVIAVVISFMLFNVSPRKGIGFGLVFVLLMSALIGFTDDLAKVRGRRNKGLGAKQKMLLLFAIALPAAYLSVYSFNVDTALYFFKVNDTKITLHWIAYFTLVYLMFVGATNAVNLTDGIDGLASGSMILSMSAFILIAFIQFRNSAFLYPHIEGSLDVAIFAASVMGACIGFLWWNAHPAKIFMGDTGSLALGSTLAMVAVYTKTEILLMIIGGLFVLETFSVIIQVFVFKASGRKIRVFRMAPIHHHFEQIGWSEPTVLVRFWIVAGVLAGFGFILFYINYVGNL